MKKKKGLIIYLSIAVFILLLNVLAWGSTAFCDAYIRKVFPLWVNTYGRLTGLVSFSVGEIMLGMAVLLTVFAVVLGIVVFILKLAGRSRKDGSGQKNISSRGRISQAVIEFAGRFYVVFAWIVLVVCLVMTLNCFILYHASTFSEQYFGEAEDSYTMDELLKLRNFVVEECNRLSKEMDREDDGTVIFPGDMKQQAIEAMKLLGQTYDRLDGYYPRPKPLYTSDFFCQQYMCGYYFPFSMEANYNDVMYIMNKPATMCHELAHLRGYIYEDEANFISFLACVQSGNKVFEYAGYLSVLNYLDNDFYRAVGKNREAYLAQPVIDEQVIEDNVFVTDEEWERINERALLETEMVANVTDTLVDASLKINGVNDGKISYSRVVNLLLLYYGQ